MVQRNEKGQFVEDRLGKSAKEFSRAVTRFSKTLPDEFLAPFVQKIALQILSGVVLKTPVDTGRARGNWQVTTGAPAEGVVELLDQGGGSTVSKGQSTILSSDPFEVVWLTNNLPYIERLENGWSMQAPAGMVALTLDEVRSQFPD